MSALPTLDDPREISSSSERRCSIVVRAFNEARHVGRLIAGLRQQTVQDFELILVDSGSTDGTVEIVQQAASQNQVALKVVHISPDEFTFGRSLNLGIAHAASEFIVIASAHVYPVYADWLERLLAPFVDPQVGLVYGKQRGTATSYFSEHQIFAHWFPEISQARQAHPFCNNANAAVRRSVWLNQPYDETLTGLEDLDWARRMMQAGHAIAYVAEAEIIHVHNETPRGVYNRYRREAMAFKRIFPQERFGIWNLVRLVITNVASDLWHASQQGEWQKPGRLVRFYSILWFRWMQFWGTYQGYRRPGPVTWQLRQTFYYPRGFVALPSLPSRQAAVIQYEQSRQETPGAPE